jgi:hypothetical protein
LELPNPQQIQEETIRPLLAVLDQAARATLLALDAEHADGWADPYLDGEAPSDAAAWMATALAVQIEGLLRILRTHDRALRERHRLRPDRGLDF